MSRAANPLSLACCREEAYPALVMKILASLLSLFLCASCTTVVSKQPVGSKPVNVEKAGLTGTWINDNGERSVFVMKDPAKGSLVIMDKDDEQEILVRQTGKVLFANLKDEKEDYYAWAELKLVDDRLRIRIPDFDKFAKLIGEKKLKARIIQDDRIVGEKVVDSTDIVIDDAKGTWVEMLAAGKLGDVYDKDDNQFLKRPK